MARRGRLEAYFKDSQLQRESIDSISQLAQILQPQDLSDSKLLPPPLSPAEVATVLGNGKDLPQSDYEMILQYLGLIGQQWRSNKDMPHPVGALILPPRAIERSKHTIDKRVYSTNKANDGGSGIQFKNPFNNLVRTTGFITKIWQLPLEGHMQTFFTVEHHKPLSLSDQWKTPYHSMPRFGCTAVDAAPSGQTCIIEARHILTQLTVYKRPAGTYNIKHNFLIICISLNRGRRS
ncbi:hypothetical protein DFH09DRAFT_915643 [Mycena vulgaris]|nr:hypothetical protein DFH09DRAFT_915643 [Mycena vulgaris]